MIFTQTKLKGAYIIEIEPKEDERGFFARIWDKVEFKKVGLNTQLVQCSISFNKVEGTLRGMHYQKDPFGEEKIVGCTKGKIFDAIVDLRENSSTFKDYFAIELSQKNHKMLYVPGGFAHGFITLNDNCEVFYQISTIYIPEVASGVRWDDPAFSIKWPIKPIVISEKDKSYPNYEK